MVVLSGPLRRDGRGCSTRTHPLAPVPRPSRNTCRRYAEKFCSEILLDLLSATPIRPIRVPLTRRAVKVSQVQFLHTPFGVSVAVGSPHSRQRSNLGLIGDQSEPSATSASGGSVVLEPGKIDQKRPAKPRNTPNPTRYPPETPSRPQHPFPAT